ncbi:MAG: YitT family protein [Clostridia bacterium]|nr:YitT family protein [Clostridia bacterium]
MENKKAKIRPKKKSVSERVKDYILITVGSIIYAAGIALFLDPNNLAPGGVSGIAIIINHFAEPLSVGVIIVLMNIPIMILGVVKFGFRFLLSSIYSVVLSSAAMELFGRFIGPLTDNLFLAAAAGGALQAIGIGLVFRAGATTGGIDIIVRVMRQRYRYIKTGTLFLLLDSVVITISGVVFKNIDVALYAALALTVYMTVFNSVLYGGDGARLVYIISASKDNIAKRILTELDAGATVLSGKGAYTGQEKEVLMVVLRMRALPEARDIVREEDKDAFMIVTKATSVFGEGFKSHDEEDL